MDENKLNDLEKRINDLLDESNKKLLEIISISDNSKQKESELNDAHSRIIDLKNAVEGSSKSLEEIFNDVSQVKIKIDELYQQATRWKNEIEQFHSDSSTKTAEITTYYSSFQDIKKKVENPDDGVVTLVDKTKEIFEQILVSSKEVSDSREEALKNKLKSDSIIEETVEIKEKVNAVFSDSEALRNDIGKILNLVRDTGLANSFDKRRKRSQGSSVIALSVIIFGVIISICSINKVFFTTQGENLFSSIQSDYIKFLLRLTLTAPGVFTAWFGAIQYSKERFFLEQYEFKTAAALALENYTKLLKENYSKKEDEIFELNLELIRSVYKEPIYIRPKTSIFSKFKNLEIKAEQ